MSAESYVLHVHTEHQKNTDSALEAWLAVNPHATIDDAISDIFQFGCNVQLALTEANKEVSHA